MTIVATIVALVIVCQTSIHTVEKSNTEKRNITVTVPNVTSNKGTVNYALYDKDNFMKAESYRTEQSPDGYLLFKSERLIEL